MRVWYSYFTVRLAHAGDGFCWFCGADGDVHVWSATRPLKATDPGYNPAAVKSEEHFIMQLSVQDWKDAIDLYKIKKSLIPHRTS
eukprot:m.277740 g.277740  ORF g.277740 m.277740 type:complete len:85 (+) comp19789_c0_seq2:266-520(+)